MTATTPTTSTHHLNGRATRTTLALCLLAAGVVLPTIGCSSSSTRSGSNNINEIDPAMAYARQRHVDALEHYNTASQLHLDDKPDEALAEYRIALELDNKLFAAWNNMGQLLMAEGNNQQAMNAYQIASGLEPTDPRPEYNIGIIYQKLGWAKDSYEHFEMAIARDANYLPALHGVIRSAEMLGIGDAKILNYIRNAQLRETDDQWREYLSTQHYRVQALIDN